MITPKADVSLHREAVWKSAKFVMAWWNTTCGLPARCVGGLVSGSAQDLPLLHTALSHDVHQLQMDEGHIEPFMRSPDME